MTWHSYFLLFVISLSLLLLVASFQSSPGYMDADYYFAGGLRLVQGFGFSEDILWNYLDDPVGLPHPSHAYWMPLASMMAALGMMLVGLHHFAAARMSFILLSACMAPFTAYLSFQLIKRRDLAMMSGWLAIFSVFYLAYLPTTDVFGLYMVFGSLSLVLYHVWERAKIISGFRTYLFMFLLGLLAGLMHLTRTDGILWLFIAMMVLVSFWFTIGSKRKHFLRDYFLAVGLSMVFCFSGYMLIMGPWMFRNILVFRTPLSPGGTSTLWITKYDELFIYPAALLTPARWWREGLEVILRARLWAAGQNLQTALAVQGEIFLAPLVIAGLWQLRKNLFIRVGILAWCLTLFTMTMVFPFQGARGGFFHSGAALQPLFWVAAPVGLESFLAWGNQQRGWDISQARRFFQIALIFLAFLLTVFIAQGRIMGKNDQVSWNASYDRYILVENRLVELGAMPQDVVLVNNSPGYYAANGRPSLSIPYGDLQVVFDVAHRYQARYLLLEISQLQGEDDLFNNPGDRPGLRYLGTYEDVRIFEFLDS